MCLRHLWQMTQCWERSPPTPPSTPLRAASLQWTQTSANGGAFPPGQYAPRLFLLSQPHTLVAACGLASAGVTASPLVSMLNLGALALAVAPLQSLHSLLTCLCRHIAVEPSDFDDCPSSNGVLAAAKCHGHGQLKGSTDGVWCWQHSARPVHSCA